jgi:hypothetical protein
MERDETERDEERPDTYPESTFEDDALGVPDYGTSAPPREAVPPDAQMPPGERPRGSDAWGTTASEQRTGRSLDDRLAAEVPDRPARDDGGSVRLADDGGPDDTPELIANDDIANDDEDDLDDASAEEAAVHERRDAPGATTAPDSYVSEEAPDATGGRRSDGGS